MQDNKSEYMECLFQILSLYYYTPFITFNNGGIIINRREVEQQKYLLKLFQDLTLRKKGVFQIVL